MQNVNSKKAGERSFAVVLLSFGVGSGLSVFVTELTGQIISIVLGLVFILAVVFGFHKRLAAFFYKVGGKGLNNVLSIFMPFIGVILFSLYSVAVLIGVFLGGSFSASIDIIAALSGLLALANLIEMVLNIYALLERPKISQE